MAQAEGVQPRGFNGYDIEAFKPGASGGGGTREHRRDGGVQQHQRQDAFRHLARPCVRKRRTEVDVQIAPIAEIGARHGIDCRATRKLVEMIHEVEEGRRPMTDDNLLELARVNYDALTVTAVPTSHRRGRAWPGHPRLGTRRDVMAGPRLAMTVGAPGPTMISVEEARERILAALATPGEVSRWPMPGAVSPPRR